MKAKARFESAWIIKVNFSLAFLVGSVLLAHVLKKMRDDRPAVTNVLSKFREVFRTRQTCIWRVYIGRAAVFPEVGVFHGASNPPSRGKIARRKPVGPWNIGNSGFARRQCGKVAKKVRTRLTETYPPLFFAFLSRNSSHPARVPPRAPETDRFARHLRTSSSIYDTPLKSDDIAE